MKTRFCPSPTGVMHLGNVRTALFSFLLAKSQGGQFLLRIEDKDRARSYEKYTKAIMKGLEWLGLQWDEGPYYQSERQTIYDEYFQRLEKEGFAYPCFCSDKQLALTRKAQLSVGKPPRYPETCRHLSAKEVAQKISEGQKPTLRFHVTEHKTVEFLDTVKGMQHFNSDDVGDFIIRRADGTASFMFCNAIDDALMGVTHVLRGEDHLTNTPRQIMILESLGLPVPQYGHISLITGLAGDKLSKRRGSFSLDDVRQDGILPLALINYLARLGHYYAENNFMSLSELATHFKTESLNTSSAKFDKPQLMHWQKKAIVALDTETFWQWMGEAVHTLVPTDSKDSFIEAIKTIVIVPDDAFYWAQIFFGDSLTFDDDKIAILQNVGAAFYEHALRSVAQHGTDSGKTIAVLKEKTGLTGKPLFLPLRLALTGEAHGPDLQTVFTLLGTDLLEQRLNYVQSLL